MEKITIKEDNPPKTKTRNTVNINPTTRVIPDKKKKNNKNKCRKKVNY